MLKKKLGNTDLTLSCIGLGTWAMGGGSWSYGWGPQDDQQSIACIHEAIDSGINWIDTAAVYGLGHSETIIGRALKSRSEKIYIATKCGLLADKNGDVYGNLKRESIQQEVEASLKRLQVDCIDIYQIHWPNPPADISEAFSTLLELKKQGKIRYASVSNFSKSQLEEISKLGEVASLQSPYSILDRKVEIDVIPWCIRNNCGFLAYSPLQCGILTGKVTKEWVKNLPNDDWRKTKSEYFSEPGLSKVLDYIESLRDRISADSLSDMGWLSGLALNWLISKPGVSSVIVGARKQGQIREILKNLNLVFSAEELQEVSMLTPPKFT